MTVVITDAVCIFMIVRFRLQEFGKQFTGRE